MMATSRITEIPFSRLSIHETQEMEERMSSTDPYEILVKRTERLSRWLGITEHDAEQLILNHDPRSE